MMPTADETYDELAKGKAMEKNLKKKRKRCSSIF
jgi:hypothetical protein